MAFTNPKIPLTMVHFKVQSNHLHIRTPKRGVQVITDCKVFLAPPGISKPRSPLVKLFLPTYKEISKIPNIKFKIDYERLAAKRVPVAGDFLHHWVSNNHLVQYRLHCGLTEGNHLCKSHTDWGCLVDFFLQSGVENWKIDGMANPRVEWPWLRGHGHLTEN